MTIMNISSNENYLESVFSEAIRYDFQKIQNSSFIKCNLNGPIFFSCKIENCHFESTDLSNTRVFQETTFRECTFDKCDMRSLGLRNAIFEKCLFKRCDMLGTALGNAEWNFCEFNNCKFADLDIHTSNCVGCKFTGTLREIRFIGKNKSKLEIDLSDSKLDAVEFIDCDLSLCIPPKAKNHFYINNIEERIKLAENYLNEESDITKKIVRRRLSKISNMRQYIFNTSSLREIEGNEVSSVLEKIFSIN